MEQALQEALAAIKAMSPAEFAAVMEEARGGEVAVAMRELAAFEQFLTEQDQPT